jgi:hypothetical protein
MTFKWGDTNLRENSQGDKFYDYIEEEWEIIP